MIKRPKTVDEYLDLVHQAVYEVDEFQCIIGDDDEERYVNVLPLVKALDESLRALYDDMTQGRYQFAPGGPDLPCMAIAAQIGPLLPFKPLLKVINETHREGLDV